LEAWLISRFTPQFDILCQEPREVKYLNLPITFSKCPNF
jgi:hypothetical protein